jgi:hypothetical protein
MCISFFYYFCLGCGSLQLILLELAVEIHVGLHMMFLLLSDFNRSRNVSVNFSKTLQYKILLTTSQVITCGQIYRLGEANISFFISVVS